MIKKFITLISDFTVSFANSLGFHDLVDLITSIFVFKSIIKSTFLTFLIVGTASLASIIMFIEGWIFMPAISFFLYMVLITCETFTGTLVAIKINKEKFNLDKSLRFFSKLVAQSGVLILSFHMGKSSEFYIWLPTFIFVSITGINFLKTVRNLGRLNWLEGEVVSFIERKFEDKEANKTD